MVLILVKITDKNRSIAKFLMSMNSSIIPIAKQKNILILPNPLKLQILVRHKSNAKMENKMEIMIKLIALLLKCSGKKNVQVVTDKNDTKTTTQFANLFINKIYNENKLLILDNFIIDNNVAQFVFNEYILKSSTCPDNTNFYDNYFERKPVGQLLMSIINDNVYINESKSFPQKSFFDSSSKEYVLTKFILTSDKLQVMEKYEHINRVITSIKRILTKQGVGCGNYIQISDSKLNFDKNLGATLLTKDNLVKYTKFITELVLLHPGLWFYCGGSPSDECVDVIIKHPDVIMNFIRHIYQSDYSDIIGKVKVHPQLIKQSINENYPIDDSGSIIVKPLQPIIIKSNFNSVHLSGLMFTGQIYRKKKGHIVFDSNVSHVFLIVDKVRTSNNSVPIIHLFGKSLTLASMYSNYCEPVVYDDAVSKAIIPLNWFERNKSGRFTSVVHYHFVFV